MKRCKKCKGTGKIQVSNVDYDRCRACGGSGSLPASSCSQEADAQEHLVMKAAKHLLLAATGPAGGEDSWEEEMQRCVELIDQLLPENVEVCQPENKES